MKKIILFILITAGLYANPFMYTKCNHYSEPFQAYIINKNEYRIEFNNKTVWLNVKEYTMTIEYNGEIEFYDLDNTNSKIVRTVYFDLAKKLIHCNSEHIIL